jgi:hypothetical protein
LNAFLAQYPEGYYANLARLQLAKLAAAEAPAAVAPPAAPPASESATAATKAAPQQTASTDASADTSSAPAADNAQVPRVAPPQTGLVSSVQTELKRVGCLTGSTTDGEWNAATQRSMTLFNKNAGTAFDVKLATAEALDAIKLRPARVCPLICEHGFKADGDYCTRIVCAEGSVLNDNDECERRRAKTNDKTSDKASDTRRDRRARAGRGDRQDRSGGPVERFDYHGPGYDIGVAIPRPQAAPRRPQTQGSGQIFCDSWGCRAVARGCHIESLGSFAMRATGGLGVVCN